MGTALRHNRQGALDRLLDLRNTVEVASVTDPRRRGGPRDPLQQPGPYVLVCFVENHQRQGMYRFVRVR